MHQDRGRRGGMKEGKIVEVKVNDCREMGANESVYSSMGRSAAHSQGDTLRATAAASTHILTLKYSNTE